MHLLWQWCFFGKALTVIPSHHGVPPILSPPLHASCMATFHTGADVSCCTVWEKYISLLEYEQQMVRTEQEERCVAESFGKCSKRGTFYCLTDRILSLILRSLTGPSVGCTVSESKFLGSVARSNKKVIIL